MKKLMVLFAVILISVIFIIYGRSIYMPIMHKIKGKESIASVTTKITLSVTHRLRKDLDKIGIETYPSQLVFVGLKEEQKLQVYSEKDSQTSFIKEYPFTAYSGDLGPKLKRGDKQIPEGVYKIEYLNPNSAYHLSLKIDYPNAFDRSKTKFSNIEDMGDNIFIHGEDASIGCIPIGNKAIEEVFFLAQKAGIENVKVIISPRDFRVNASYPSVESIDWAEELYELIKAELSKLRN